ncbi:MAG: sulfatase [Verrucomicrobiae bacterium]|nr:sulfatase [Verrucomicrobiae bacterium]NNJ44314.1 sulfatase [Akkermansiaceae bacterium]
MRLIPSIRPALLAFLAAIVPLATAADKPNILFLFSDDHALNAISAYGSALAKVAPTPHIDRLADEGAIFENSFCANSICGPSRACILTGKHSHKNGFMRNTGKGLDQSQWTLSKTLQKSGYATAVIGKWHLHTKPRGFDYWEVLPGQGKYYNPDFIQMDGEKKQFTGYVTDITTDKAIAWLDRRDKTKPFFLMCQHKAPHRTFSPALRHLKAFEGVEIPEPASLFDDYASRSQWLPKNEMEIDRHFNWAYDLKLREDERAGIKLPGLDLYGAPEYDRMNAAQRKQWVAHFGPKNQAFLKDFKAGKLSNKDMVRWKFQRYMRNYLATVKSVDESVGRMLKYLDDQGLAENTLVIYSSDQGFFLGEHGWYDKRWMFEESFKMPFLIRWPGQIKPGSRPEALIQNIDYAPTLLEAAGMPVPEEIQGKSIVPVLKDSTRSVRDSLYYAYYELGEHNVPQHYGVRTRTHKLFYIPSTQEWQMFDLVKDPSEMVNVYGHPEYALMKKELTAEYKRLRKEFDAPSYEEHAPKQ